MAQRKLNKNVVAGLTIGAMSLITVVAAVAAMNLAQRDPQALAQKAAVSEKAGDFEQALRKYYQAFKIDKEGKYLVDCARMAFRLGDVPGGVGQLDMAVRQSADDPLVLNAVLERAWELRGAGWPDADKLLEYAESLTKAEPQNVLGWVSKLDAQTRLVAQGKAKHADVDETLKKCSELKPNDPRLAMLRAVREVDLALDPYRDRRLTQSEFNERNAKYAEAQERMKEILRAAVAESPGDERAVLMLAAVHRERRELDDAVKVIDAGIAAAPSNAEFRQAAAELAFATGLGDDSKPDDAEKAELLKTALEHAKRAIELEPALFPAYRLRALLTIREARLSGRLESDPLAVRKEILETLTKALFNTQSLRGVKAFINTAAGLRERMFAEAFDLAVTFHEQSDEQPAKDALLPLVQRVVDETRTQFKESIFVPLMEGRLALLKKDTRAAIQAFERADQKAGAAHPMQARIAKEQLSRIHAAENRSKLSLDYAESAMKVAAAQGIEPTPDLVKHRITLLNTLGRHPEALDAVDALLARYPDDRETKVLKADTLAKLDRTEEARKIMEELTGAGAAAGDAQDVKLVLYQARLAAQGGDLAGAEKIVRSVLDKDPEMADAIRLLVQIIARAYSPEDAVKALEACKQKATAPSAKAAYDTYIILVSTKDPAERDAKLLALIHEVADPCDRSAELFNFYLLRQKYPEAAPHLDEVEKCRGADNVEVARLQLFVNIQIKQFEKAEQAVARLTQKNADGVKGATFRGQLKAARGDFEGALVEFRAAERELLTDVELKSRIADALVKCTPPRWEDAIASLKQAVEFDPRNFLINRFLFQCYQATGRESEGIPYLEMAAKISPNDEFVKERKRLLDETRNPAEGVAWREQQRKDKPDDWENLLRLAELHDTLDHVDEAEKCILEAAAAQPDKSAVALAAAKFYAKRKMREKGETFLRAFADRVQGAAKIDSQLLLARFYESLEDYTAANAVLLDAEAKITELAGSDENIRERGKIALFLAKSDFYGRLKPPKLELQADALRSVLAAFKPTETEAIIENRLKLIAVTLEMQKLDQAVREIDAFVKDYPKDPRGLIAKADLILRQSASPEALGEAREYLTRALQEKPDHAWSLFTRAKINMAQGRNADAREDLIRAKRVAPDGLRFEHRLTLARLYEITGQYPLAESEIRELVTKMPNERQLALNLIGLLERSGQANRSQEFINEQISREPKEYFWRYQLGRVLTNRKDHCGAAEQVRQAVELSNAGVPELIGAWFDALNKCGRPQDTLDAARRLKPEALTPRVRSAIADAYFRMNDRAAALQVLEEGLIAAATSSVEDVQFLIGAAFETVGLDDASALMRKLLDRTEADLPYQMRIKSVLAQLLLQSGDPARTAEAIALADEVVTKTPPGSTLQLTGMRMKAIGLTNQGDPKSAVALYETILRVLPDDIQALNNLAFVFANDLNQPKVALRYAEQANLLSPGDANVLDTLGWAHAQNGNLPQAEATLLEALRLDSTNLAAMHHLAQVYQKQGRRSDAKKAADMLVSAAKERNSTEYQQKAETLLKTLE